MPPKKKEKKVTGNIILDAVIILAVIGILAAVVLFFIEKKFHVEEDPRIDMVAALLPGANCGGCGFAGCRGLATEIVKTCSLEKQCPAGGSAVTEAIAAAMGIEATAAEPKVAVIRCQGNCENAPAKVKYDSAVSCAFANMLYAGESSCPNACLGCGDCVKACRFGAIKIDEITKLPIVDENICGGCGSCARACPRGVIEIRKKGPKGRRVFVSCVNKEKGAAAMKNCKVSCIGCGKCVKVCAFDAITVDNNVAHIDESKCKLCRKCVAECPKGAIIAVNFPAPKTQETSTEPNPSSLS